jgi:hypothetical protein
VPDYQHVVDEIRAYLAAPGHAVTPEIEILAQEFARHCREANERLRECQNYLRKGLRSEAIHLAEKHPMLLDMFSALDFLELPDWRIACATLSLTAPPHLSLEAAQALSDAYAEESPLQTLLTAHRMLNLAQAPLESRVKILRKIAAADAATLFWGDDLEALEQLRLAEIEAQARDAERREELGWLESLVNEVRDSNWSISVPVLFKKKMDESLERLTNKTGEKMLRAMLPRLDSAYSAMNLTESIAVLSQWDHIVKVCKQHLPSELLNHATAIREWVAQEELKAATQKEFEEACIELQAGLDRDLPTIDLEKRFLATTRFSYEIPSDLERRYQQRMSDRNAASRRRHQLTLGAIAAAVVAILVISGIIYYQSTYNSNVKRWVDAAQDAEFAVSSNGDLQRGISIKESIKKEGNRYLANPDLLGATARLDTAIEAERKRDAAFKAKLAQLQGGGKIADEATLKVASALALRSDEKSAIQIIQDDFAQAQEAKRHQADQQFMDAAAALRTTMIKQLTPAQSQTDRTEYLRELASCDATLKDLENRSDVTESTRQSITSTLRALLKQAAATLTAAEQDRQMIQAVADSNSSALNQTTIKDYLNSLPLGSKRDSFTAAQLRGQGDADVEAWNTLVSTWVVKSVPQNENAATSRVREIEKYIADHPKSPLLLHITAYRDFMKRGLDAVAEDGVWNRTLVRQMSSDLYRKLFIIETKTGKAYYTPEVPDFKVDMIDQSFDAYLSPDLAATKKVHLAKAEGAVMQPGSTFEPPKSPQMIAAEKVRDSIRHMTFDQWPYIGLTAFETFEQSKCHPVVRASTLLRISQLNQETLDWAIGKKLDAAIKQLADLKLDDLHWLDPNDQPSSAILANIDTAVRNLPTADELRKLVQSQLSTIEAPLSTGFIGRGCLIAMPNEEIGIKTSVKPDDGLIVVAVNVQLPKTIEDPVFVRVGRADGGKWALEKSISDKLPEGTLLFIAQER